MQFFVSLWIASMGNPIHLTLIMAFDTPIKFIDR